MRFNNWNLQMDTFPVRQYDNLTRRLEVSGDIPEGWSWVALLSIGDNLNIISLQYGEPGLYVDLTADMIPYAGKYNLQLRATQGDKVRHTNIVQMQVNDSMSGDEVWPELPSEFSQAEQRITELNEHPPKPGDNGFWLIWNVETDQYEPSDIPLPSGGGSGPAGGYYTPEVTQPSDNTMQVSFAASEDDMPPVEPVSVTLPAGPAGRDGEDGAPGLPGQDGFSPTVQTEPIEGGTKVTITDATGPKEFEVMDGTNGQDGQPGRDGEPGAPGTPGRDGYSPIVQTAAIDGGTRVTITDADGPKTFDVLNGTNGEDGEPGQDGAPGQDGFSPTASVTQTEYGAKITITDKSGTTNATITNGKDGTNGTDGADGQTPNITPGNIETLPAGSDATASITGQTPNLVLNLGIPQGPAGAGVPSTEGVPTDYLLSPAGWVAPPSGGGENWELIIDHVVPETVASVLIDQDLNGEAFSLKKWALLTIWLPDENVSTQERCRVGFHPSTGWNNGSIYETSKAPTNAEIAGCTLAFCSFTNGLIKLDDIYWSINYTNMAYEPLRQYQGVNQSGGFVIDPSTKEIVSTYRDSYATCVKINTISRTAVRKGSIIRLWGVRA